jgi:hypothetical protein
MAGNGSNSLPRKGPKTGIWGGRLITVESAGFYARKAGFSFCLVRPDQVNETNSTAMTAVRYP